MDVKSLISCRPSNFGDTFKEAPYSLLKVLEPSPIGVKGKPDALEAVKLDPAVLEAQVTVHTKDKANNATNLNNTRNAVIEKKKEKVPTPSPPPSSSAPAVSQRPKGFEDMIMQHEAALLSLTPHQLDLLMKYADILRRQRMITQKYLECAFCKNNGKPSFWYTSHALRDVRGRVRCPILRGFHCPRCGATGDRAHTIKYCPDNSLTDSRSSCSGHSSL